MWWRFRFREGLGMILYVVMCVCVGYQKKITQRTRDHFSLVQCVGTLLTRTGYVQYRYVHTSTVLYCTPNGLLKLSLNSTEYVVVSTAVYCTVPSTYVPYVRTVPAMEYKSETAR